ncbi:hypothetical protein [Nonomuraea phyllanthi]|uniref:hypothetical protein n=1 Tax=Nonomuraea phyllanthi TaxID=2219224 RepID=UPI001D14B6DB|nr:hypothetical protein [Nonomuraea phyllanthi]
MDIASAGKLWDAEPGWLNTASYGLPPRRAFEELQAVLAEWRHGSGDWKPWDASVGRARAAFARLVGAPAADVTVGSTVSQIMGTVATALPPGARGGARGRVHQQPVPVGGGRRGGDGPRRAAGRRRRRRHRRRGLQPRPVRHR